MNEAIVAANTYLPQKLWFRKKLGKNSVSQVKYPGHILGRPILVGQTISECGKQILVSDKRIAKMPAGIDDVLWVRNAETQEWCLKTEFNDPKWDEIIQRRRAASDNLKGKFTFVEEERNGDGRILIYGLRPPQIGAIYSVLGRWKMSSDLATIVMPTGVGKTDSMIALMAIVRPRCLLVVVPTDALRSQLAEKFLTFGVLTQFGLLPRDVAYPVVGVLHSGFENEAEIRTFCDCCNVIVTTMPLLGTFSDLDQKVLASCCSHLFIDEAHHVKATTWNRLRARFDGKPILQFTATPYRNDGQHVDGPVVFDYPLRKAQQEGYFKKIVLKELWDYVDPEQAVARTAIEQLKADLAAGFDHIVMARSSNIAKAETLLALYEGLGPEFCPVVVHSKLTSTDLNTRLDQLRTRKSRIAICVAMFGEGFDFPELKIAALHDIHQSLAVTIQFTGRFTRSNPQVGVATIVVNRANTEVDDSVRELYAQGGGADWNDVLTKLTEGATEAQIVKETFYKSFSGKSLAVPIHDVKPRMSTVVYRTKVAKWNPWSVEKLPLKDDMEGDLSVSLSENTAFFMTLTRTSVEWADVAALTNEVYDLYALFWDSQTRLLYINSSNNASVHEDIAKAVGGDDVELIHGVEAFKVMHGIKRLLLRNMGLNDRLRRSVRFMMFTGTDIQGYLDSAQAYGKEKTHVFGDGFNGTSRVTVGTSKKGRIWSWREAQDLLEWKKWCREIGAKLIDPTIDPDSFLQESFIPEDITKPPDLYPISIEWPDELYERSEDSMAVEFDGRRIPFFDVGLDLLNPAPGAPIRFKVFTDETAAAYELKFIEGKVAYQPTERDPSFWIGRRSLRLSEFFSVSHPIVRYEKDCFSKGDQLLRPRLRRLYTFNTQKILTWNWDGIDLTKESQTIAKREDSIQRRTIETVTCQTWDREYEIVFDDDAAGEAADVVCISSSKGKLEVDLFHCKYSKGKPGERVKDLYEVCGQAQRSIKWRENIERLFLHLLNREKDRMRKTGVSRFERGTFKQLQEIRIVARALVPEFRVFIVQPGLSKAQVSDDQRELLGTTELYLYETLGIQFGVIASNN
jgi:superfamily II DNA or RNA helicase